MPVNIEEHIRLLEAMVELRLLKAGLEETLDEFKCHLFGTKSEKTKTTPDSTVDETENPPVKTTVKEHTRMKKKKSQEG